MSAAVLVLVVIAVFPPATTAVFLTAGAAQVALAAEETVPGAVEAVLLLIILPLMLLLPDALVRFRTTSPRSSVDEAVPALTLSWGVLTTSWWAHVGGGWMAVEAIQWDFSRPAKRGNPIVAAT